MTIRVIAEDELLTWLRAMDISFLSPTPDGAETYMREFFKPGRLVGAFSGSECVGTLRTLDLELTVPGGACVPAEGITNVGVVPAHRRRGLLGQLMRTAMDGAVERGRGLAALIASGYGIYGRYGFGPATRGASWDIDVRRAGQVRLPGAAACGVEPASMAQIRERAPGAHERFRRVQVGAINRTALRWRIMTGDLRSPYHSWTEPMAVLCTDSGGSVAGAAMFRVEETWTGGDPDHTLKVDDMFAAHPDACAALWQHLLTMDWITRVSVARIAPDDPLPLLLANPRAIGAGASTGRDHLWVRILDTPTALEARQYDGPGRLVLDIADRLGYTPGRFALETGQDGKATVSRTDEPADLALDVSVLATMYLGDRTAAELAAAAQITQLRDDAVRRADRLFRITSRPWCPDSF